MACVTGASYGVGRGISEVLGQCGATIYLTGRSTRKRPATSASWTIEDSADLIVKARPVGCVFERVTHPTYVVSAIPVFIVE